MALNEDRIMEILNLILDENREMNRRLSKVEVAIDKLQSEQAKLQSEQAETNRRLSKVEVAIEKLQSEQAKTNLLLNQHTQDFLRLADFLQEKIPRYNEVVELEMLGQTEKGQRVLIKKTS